MKGTAIACDFLIGLQLLAAYICTYKWGMHSKLLRVCCADTTNDQVMYLRSDNTAIAMGEVKTAERGPLTVCWTQQAPATSCKLTRQIHSQGL